ncbi:MAG TPA: formyltetrahydrofolate deformylase [Candidatus Manganitrophaceae bacterium]|nr:formyltetrahydrofolate deformylase [Candidatus Manganitrophaceae bacterium]
MEPKAPQNPFWPPLPNSHQEIGRLLISCPDRPGIVAAVSRFLFERGANIIHSDQHSTDPTGGTFFMRVEFRLPELEKKGAELERGFGEVAARFGMQWRLAYAGRVKRLAIFVSKAEHALFELLWRRRAGDLRAEIVTVISNHPDLQETVSRWGIPFHHLPIDPNQKREVEERQVALMEGQIDTVVLARYMQIVTPDFIRHYPDRIINIHHSFLPAFVGAEPYSRAHERGVKLIGATAHYVTADLDAGPIIEQDVERVDHRHSVEDLKRIGRYIERTVLARAVAWHVEDRILVYGNKTVVFA